MTINTLIQSRTGRTEFETQFFDNHGKKVVS